MPDIVDDLLRAFPAGTAPARPITGHRCDECDEVDDLMGGRTWPEVAKEFPTYCHDAFPLLNPEAKDYYLPAYMCFDVMTSGWTAGVSVCGSFERGEFAPEQFDDRQRAVIVRWLERYYRSNPNEVVPEDLAKGWGISPIQPALPGLKMRGLELRDSDGRGLLTFDLRDILACLGSDATERTWTCQNVDCTGEGVDEFFEATYRRQAISGDKLLGLSRRVLQIIDGTFLGMRPGETVPSVVIRSIDSTLWEVFGSDECLLKIESGFTDVRPASPDVG